MGRAGFHGPEGVGLPPVRRDKIICKKWKSMLSRVRFSDIGGDIGVHADNTFIIQDNFAGGTVLYAEKNWLLVSGKFTFFVSASSDREVSNCLLRYNKLGIRVALSTGRTCGWFVLFRTGLRTCNDGAQSYMSDMSLNSLEFILIGGVFR